LRWHRRARIVRFPPPAALGSTPRHPSIRRRLGQQGEAPLLRILGPDTIASLRTFADTLVTDWWPYIGDPTLGGWLITIGYLLAAVGCIRALQVARRGAAIAADYPGVDRRARDRRAAYRASVAFWSLLAVIFVALGINKQLDLHACITFALRDIAIEQGWWQHRRSLQIIFVGLVGGGGLAALGILLHATRELLPRHVLAFVGMVLLACFLVARTSSYHHLDGLLRQAILGIKIRELLELAGIACVAACAAANCWWHDIRPRLADRPADTAPAVS
jgi:hypothetical protein